MTERDRLERLAVEVSDGVSVDWGTATGEDAGECDGTVLANLRAIDLIATTLRGQPQGLSAPDLSALNDSFDGWAEQHVAGQLDPVQAGDHWGPLEVREKLGSGAYADVFEAYDPALERRLALKLFRFTDPDLQEKMLEEGRRLARIDHPNVVRVHGAAEHEGRIGLWMEHLDGDNLAPPEGASGVLTSRETGQIGLDLCTALAAIHGAGLLHRDVKLENVVRTRQGRIVLADLGSGMDIAATGPVTPNPGGTPRYLAPEVLAGAPASRQSDLYSLGVVLYRLVSGRFPYDAEHIAALMRQQLKPAPPLLDQCPSADPAFAAIVDRLLALRPGDRFDSAGAVHAALQAVLGQGADAPEQRRPWAYRVVGLAAAIAVAWGLVQMLQPPPSMSPSRVAYELALNLERPGQDRVALGGGEALYLGDGLSMALTLEQPMHVFVFSEDDQGRAFGLFPIAALEQQNPLAAGTQHQVPGTLDGAPINWRVDSLASIERVHVVMSRDLLPEIAAAYAGLPAPALPGPADPVFRPRGMGSLAIADPAPGAPVDPLLQAVRIATGAAAVADGAVHRVFEFEARGQRPPGPD